MNRFELKEKLDELASKSYELATEVAELEALVLKEEFDFENYVAENIICVQFRKSNEKAHKAYFELDALAKIASF